MVFLREWLAPDLLVSCKESPARSRDVVGPFARAWLAIAIGLPIALAACAPKGPTLPAGTGTPFPEFASAYSEATANCRDVTTISASLGLSGKAGSTKLRGR